MKKKEVKRTANEGFTLIEMIVVLLIIGVLASIGVPRYFKSVELARTAEAQGMLKAMYEAEQRFMAREGSYTTTATSLDVDYPIMKFFDVNNTAITNAGASLNITLNRKTIPAVPAITGFGTYNFTMCNDGSLKTNSGTLATQLGIGTAC